MKKLFHVLGSIYFAILLIALVTLFVMMGTFLESFADSHRYANQYIYAHPLFLTLLAGFFVNILFSALRRLPWRKSHIGFLITHLGLLLLISGTAIKVLFGTQGSMGILEGAACSEIFRLGSQSLYIAKRDGQTWQLPVENTQQAGSLEITVLDSWTHSGERLGFWIRGDKVQMEGLPPFPVRTSREGAACAPSYRDEDWTYYAAYCDDVEKTLQTLFAQACTLKVIDPVSMEPLASVPASYALCAPIDTPRGKLTLTWENQGPSSQLNGKKNPYILDFSRPPSIAILQDPYGDDHVIAMNDRGQIYRQSFVSEELNSFYILDMGYQGYSVEFIPPFPPRGKSPTEKNQASIEAVASRLREAIATNDALSPPLQLLLDACKRSGQDFPYCLAEITSRWNASESWALPMQATLSAGLNAALGKIVWPKSLARACLWAEEVVDNITQSTRQGKSLYEALTLTSWPLLSQLEVLFGENLTNAREDAVLTAVCQQLFGISQQLPSPDGDTLGREARLFTILLRAFEIDWALLSQGIEVEQETGQALQCKLYRRITKLPPIKKLEDRIPSVRLQVRDGEKSQIIRLAYDPYGTGLKWPILDGAYVMAFQPKFKKIPHVVRLRDARQINYPGTYQPYSYESDLIIDDVETCISMNNVHETKDGYRFYMASLSPSDESSAKRAQIVVNYDPVKYWITYPGALVLSFGIAFLFIQKRGLL